MMNQIHDMLFSLCPGKEGLFSVRQLAVLAKLRLANGARDFGEVADELGMSRPALTRAADRLAEVGFLVRRQSLDDRRKIFLSLTGEGRAFHDRYIGRAAKGGLSMDGDPLPLEKGSTRAVPQRPVQQSTDAYAEGEGVIRDKRQMDLPLDRAAQERRGEKENQA